MKGEVKKWGSWQKIKKERCGNEMKGEVTNIKEHKRKKKRKGEVTNWYTGNDRMHMERRENLERK